MAGSVRIVGKVRFVYARCDADASYLAYKGLTCRFLASGNICVPALAMPCDGDAANLLI
ncbi:Uncharacterised protein [Escherichia coli]|nr:Uncharacterised protein [Escherichia coli]